MLAGTIATAGSEARHRHHQRRRALEGVLGRRECERSRHCIRSTSITSSSTGAERWRLSCCRGCLPRLAGAPRHRRGGSAPIRARSRRSTTSGAWCSRIPGILDQVMRTVPSYDNAAGKLRGFRAYPGRNRAIFNKLGLSLETWSRQSTANRWMIPSIAKRYSIRFNRRTPSAVTIERGGQKQEISSEYRPGRRRGHPGSWRAITAGAAPRRARAPPPGSPRSPAPQSNPTRSKRMTRPMVERRAPPSVLSRVAHDRIHFDRSASRPARRAVLAALRVVLLAPAHGPRASAAPARRRKGRPSRRTTKTRT